MAVEEAKIAPPRSHNGLVVAIDVVPKFVAQVNGSAAPALVESVVQVNVPSAVTAENLSVPVQVKASIKEKSVPSAATVKAEAPLPFNTPVKEEKIGAEDNVKTDDVAFPIKG